MTVHDGTKYSTKLPIISLILQTIITDQMLYLLEGQGKITVSKQSTVKPVFSRALYFASLASSQK